MKYSTIITDYFFHPCRIGELDTHQKNMGAATVHAKAYAASIQLHIAVDNQHIKNTAVKVKGCPVAMACACFIADHIINLSLTAAYALNAREIAKKLDIADGKFYAALLGEDAIKTAIRHYREKNESS